MQRSGTACITRYGFALGTFLVGVACLLDRSVAAEEDLGGGGLVAHWKFDEGSGNAVKDSSGNGNDGTIVPANATEPTWGTGEFAGAVLLSGGTVVRVPSSESLNKLKRQITVVAHVYPTSLWTPPSSIAYQRYWRRAIHLAEKLLGKSTSDEASGYIAVVQRQWREVVHPDLFYLGYGKENNVLHYKWHLGLMGAEESVYRLPEDQERPAVGEWVHLAGTYNGETGRMSLHVNGKLIGTETHVGEIRLDPESLNWPLLIGGELNGPNIDEASNQFNGYVADVRIYDRALSDDQIEVLAEQAKKAAK